MGKNPDEGLGTIFAGIGCVGLMILAKLGVLIFLGWAIYRLVIHFTA